MLWSCDLQLTDLVQYYRLQLEHIYHMVEMKQW